MSYWTGFNHFVIWGSMVFYFVFMLIFYSELFTYSYMGTATALMATSTFWLTMLLCVVLILLPVVCVKLYFYETAPTLADRVSSSVAQLNREKKHQRNKTAFNFSPRTLEMKH